MVFQRCPQRSLSGRSLKPDRRRTAGKNRPARPRKRCVIAIRIRRLFFREFLGQSANPLDAKAVYGIAPLGGRHSTRKSFREACFLRPATSLLPFQTGQTTPVGFKPSRAAFSLGSHCPHGRALLFSRFKLFELGRSSRGGERVDEYSRARQNRRAGVRPDRLRGFCRR